MKHIDPEYDGQDLCEQCSERVDLNRTLRGYGSGEAYLNNMKHWNKVLKSASLKDQLRAVQEAREAAESFRLCVSMW